MTRMPWFRLYHEARTDNKLRALTDAQHRCWFQLMCLASDQPEHRGTICDYDDELLAIETGSTLEVLRETIALLVKLRVVTDEERCLSFTNFKKRQYDKPSDEPERVRGRVSKHRGTDSNAVETPGNAQRREEKNRTEETRQEESRPEQRAPRELVLLHPAPKPEGYSAGFEAFWTAYPRRLEKKAAWRVWQARLRDGAAEDEMIEAARNYAVAKLGKDQKFVKHAATFIGPDEHYREYVDGIPEGEITRSRLGQRLSLLAEAAQELEAG